MENQEIVIVNGDILTPCEQGKVIVCHQVNCRGVMGAGLARQIKNQFPAVYDSYRRECTRIAGIRSINGDESLGLGSVLFCQTKASQTIIANLFAQDKWGTEKRQTDYEAFKRCLQKVVQYVKGMPSDVVVRLPYMIGCGLGGGKWEIIREIIFTELVQHGVKVEFWKYSPKK